MKRVLVGLILLACLLVWVTIQKQPQAAVAYNQNNLIRLHVVANSDLEEDQELKKEVRNVILRYLEPEFSQVKTRQEARSLLEKKLKILESLAQKHLRQAGREDPVRAELGRFHFPARSYGDLVLPGGEYEAVRLVIGQGQGASWWCVLFPPLCFWTFPGVWLKRLVEKNQLLPLPSRSRAFQIKFKIMEILKGKSVCFSSGHRFPKGKNQLP